MKYIRVKNDLMSIGGIIKSGTILPVENADGRWRVVEGRFEGVIINGYECEPVYTQSQHTEIYQELMNSRAEVHELKRANESLADEVECLTKAKKVKLPREVAEAVELFRANNWIDRYIIDVFFTRSCSESWKQHVEKLEKVNFDILLKALVNGYEVEEQKATGIKDEIRRIYGDWKSSPDTIRSDILVERLTDLFETRLEQENAAQSG